MAWITPKTDWQGSTDANGVYSGDYFNADDFNRIKNHLAYLRDIAIAIYKDFAINDLGEDKTPVDYFYADEINALEENLTTINENTLKRSIGEPTIYVDNGRTMTFEELNRLEGATLDLYNRLINQYEGRRMFTWNFGMKGGVL